MELFFLRQRDREVLNGLPSLVNLRASHGYVHVRIRHDGELLYQHPHPVAELIARPLRAVLGRRDPSVAHWGFGVRGPGLENVPLVRPAPRPAHEVELPSRPHRARLFDLEEISEPEAPRRGLAAFGVDPGEAGTPADAPVRVVLPERLHTAFTRTLPFSAEVEEGGFLVGAVYRDAGREDGHIVQVTAVIQAERTGASMLGFTFTGESFLRVGERIATRGRGERLLGWYHTHLFPATSGLGLSSIDLDLHRSTFRLPWQVAALVNIDSRGRVLRCYHGDGGRMERVPYWTVAS
jgi:hypothetical protein